jgi:hypothetical protein
MFRDTVPEEVDSFAICLTCLCNLGLCSHHATKLVYTTKESRKGFAHASASDTYLQDCSLSDVPSLCTHCLDASSSEEVTSITLLRFAGGEARFCKSLLFEVGTRLVSSLFEDLRSPGGHMCWRRAATSTSLCGMVVGDVALRLPLRSRGLTIFEGGSKQRSVEGDTTTES